MRSRPERVIGHIGTETRPRLTEAGAGILRNGENPTQQRRGGDEGLRLQALSSGTIMTVPEEEATVNNVQHAVIRRWQALSGFTGRKGRRMLS